MKSAATIEWWLCGECLHIAPSHTWGIKNGNNDTAVCPGCGFAHHDDENSWIEAGTELEMRRRSSEAYREARDQGTRAMTAAYDHRSEQMRQAFGFSRFYWYVVAPVELRIRHLIWRLSRV